MKLSRRTLLAGSVCSAAGLGLLAGCEALNTSTDELRKGSYITNVVRTENGNSVTVWTDRMLQAVRDGSINPPKATRGFAICHLAAFEAANAASRRFQGLLALNNAPENLSPQLAYEAAFLRCINSVFRTNYLANDYVSLTSASGDASVSIDWGSRVADIMLGMRSNDGSRQGDNDSTRTYPKRNDGLEWEPTGPNFGASAGVPIPVTYRKALLPSWGLQQPWVMRSTSQFRVPSFPDLDSPEFLSELREIAEIGGHNSLSRTSDQSEIAFFWEDGPKGVTPPGHWQIIALDLLQDRGLDFVAQARAMALISMGQADAAISTWDSKYHHDVMRPETAIRSRLASLNNPELARFADSNWQTLIPTPPFPAYTSGHSLFQRCVRAHAREDHWAQ